MIGTDLSGLIRLNALEKEIERRAQCARDLDFLRRKANTPSETALAHAEQDPTLANPRANKLVDLRIPPLSPRFLNTEEFLPRNR